MSITIIVGEPGKGKTAYATKKAVECILDHGAQDWLNCKREIETLKAGGFTALEPPPQRHVCYSDYPIKLGRKWETYHIDGFQIGLPNPYFETVLLPPYSTVILDEAQRYFNSRMSHFLREEVYGAFQIHRHNHYNFILTCQRLGNIDINIRCLADTYIVIDGLDIEKNKWGMPVKETFHLRIFHSPDVCESYCLAKEKKENRDYGEKVDISTEYNIFNFYDSFYCKPMFYRNAYNRGFDYYTESGYLFTLPDYVEFNNNHVFTAPHGYWKNAKYDDEINKKVRMTA